MAACVLRAPKEDLEVAKSRVFLRDDPAIGLHFKDVGYGYQYPNGNPIGGQIIGKGNYILRRMSRLDPETGAGYPGPEWTVGVISAPTLDYDSKRWFAHSAGAKAVMDEVIALTILFFGGN